jgi:hypothetical protein
VARHWIVPESFPLLGVGTSIIGIVPFCKTNLLANCLTGVADVEFCGMRVCVRAMNMINEIMDDYL